MKAIGALIISMVLFSCAPVLNRDLLREGQRDLSFNQLRQDPAGYKGRLYVFGGVIVQTRLTEKGSQIEAMEVPVDRYGHFRDQGMSEGRFMAFSSADERMLDPEVYRKGRRVTIAGEFAELQKGRIDEMEYTYPVFRIRQIYLWPRERQYYPAAYYDPWFYPYPYFYGGPWWSSPYYGYYGSYYGGPYYGGTWTGPRRSVPQDLQQPAPSPRPHQRSEQAPSGPPMPSPRRP